jgi:hypothetical protein
VHDKKKRYDFEGKKNKFASLLVHYQDLLAKKRRFDVDGIYFTKIRHMLKALLVTGVDDVTDFINETSHVNVFAPCVWRSGELDACGPKNFIFMKHLFAMALQLVLKQDSPMSWNVVVGEVEPAENDFFMAKFCCELVVGDESLVKISGLTRCSFSEGFINQAFVSFGTAFEVIA